MLLAGSDYHQVMMMSHSGISTTLTGNTHDSRRHGADGAVVIAMGLLTFAAVPSHIYGSLDRFPLLHD